MLRWQIALDALIQPLLSRPDAELASPVATAIRLGAFQLRHLDRIPAHAALSESVELVRAASHGHAAGMVNAILRKLTRTPPPRIPLVETTNALSIRLSHPAWLVTRWQKNYGRAAAVAICDYDQQPPAHGGLFALLEAALDQDTPLPHLDDGSRLVAELAAAAHPSPHRIWDCCAAPGGKTLILAARHPSADLLATDISLRRLRTLHDRLKTTPNARTLQADATHLPEAETAFDLILCDVPCTGTGTLSRNPELKLRLQPADLSRQAARQREILAAALAHLAPGGRLLYSTCSLEPEENEQVVAAVLAALPASSGINAAPLGPVLESVASQGIFTETGKTAAATLLRDSHLRTLPGVNLRGDGFFAALFARANQ